MWARFGPHCAQRLKAGTMTTQEKPAPGGNRETGDGDACDSANHTPIRTRLKAATINLAIWGLIPTAVATWLIQRGGLRDA